MDTPVIDFGAAVADVVPFVAHLGLDVDATTAAQRVRLPEDGRLDNHVGTRHAGALFTAAETASGMAVFALLTRAGANAVLVVADASIRYVAPARGPITASPSLQRPDDEVLAEVAEHKRAAIPVEVELADDAGAVVATASFTWVLRAPKEAK